MRTFLQRILFMIILLVAVPVVGFSHEDSTHIWAFDDGIPEVLPASAV